MTSRAAVIAGDWRRIGPATAEQRSDATDLLKQT
jgi:hypothetical protein